MTRLDEYRRCAAAGMSKAETARELGIDSSTVSHDAKRYGISFVNKHGENLRKRWTDLDWQQWMREARHELNDIAYDEIEDFRATHEAAIRDEALEQAGLSGMLRDFE